MNKTYAIIGLIIIVAIGGFVIFGKKTTAPVVDNNVTGGTPTGQTPTVGNTENVNDMADHTVTQTGTVSYTDSGFSPATITIHAGDAVNFVNNSSNNMWVASDPHPSHTNYPGFDAIRSYVPDAVYSFVFLNPGTWAYHDHLHPSMHGTIIVQ